METVPSAPERTFHLFTRLPTELRLAIWRECLPHRVAELDTPMYSDIYGWQEPVVCDLMQTSCMNEHQPLISLVCHESRAIVLEAGGYIGENKDFPAECEWLSNNMVNEWFDPARDLPHLNYCPGYETYYGTQGNPLLDLAWQAAQARRGASLRFEFLRYCSKKYLEIILRLPRCRVVMRIFVVHASRRFGAATGLFGLLGDAPVQIVDVSDQARVDAFFDLAESCEHKGKAMVRQNFCRESAEALQQELKDAVIKQVGSERQAPEMRPAIMFRLCTKMCNHSDQGEDGFRPLFRKAGE